MIMAIPFVKYIHLRRIGFYYVKKRSAKRQTIFLTVYKYNSYFQAAPVSNTLFISIFFCCMVEWTYRFNVICILE